MYDHQLLISAMELPEMLVRALKFIKFTEISKSFFFFKLHKPVEYYFKQNIGIIRIETATLIAKLFDVIFLKAYCIVLQCCLIYILIGYLKFVLLSEVLRKFVRSIILFSLNEIVFFH